MENTKSILDVMAKETNVESRMKMPPELEHQIKYILEKIERCNSYDESNSYFDLLLDYQNLVVGLIFIDNLDVSDSLWKFFKDFDRIDDQDLRKHIFKKIKNNEYGLLKD